MTVWAYLVVSDIGQVETLEDQRAWAEDLVRTRGWRLTETFSDVSTGRDGARRLLKQVIERLTVLAPADRPKRLLMIRLDRLGRGNGLDALVAFSEIRGLGVIVHTRQDGDVPYEKASQLLMPVLRVIIGGMENETRRDKAVATYDKRRMLRKTDPTVAIGSIAPYGLRLVDGRYVAKEPEARAVRYAFELRLQGFGRHTIAKRLHAVAAPWELKNGKVQEQKWEGTRVGDLLHNPAYRGVIVDDETWLAAQPNVRDVRRPTIKNEYALGGALRHECGAALVGHAGPGKGKRCPWRYYQCRNYNAHGGKMKHYRSNLLEEQFVDLLGRLQAEDGLLERYITGSTRDERKTLMARLNETRCKLTAMEDRRRKIFEAFESGSLGKRDLNWRLDDLRTQEEALRAAAVTIEDELAVQRAHFGSLDHVRALVSNAATHWLAAPIDERRALAKAIGDALGGLVVSQDGILRPYATAEGSTGSAGANSQDEGRRRSS